MPNPAQPIVSIVNFPGIITTTDPRDLPGGAAEDQVNLAVITSGELRVRAGIVEVKFDSD